MKNFFKIFSFKKIKNNLIIVLKRFPISLFLIILLTILFFLLLHWNFDYNIENNIIKWTLSIIMTFFFSLSFYLSLENFKGFDSSINKMRINLFQIIPLSFWVLFYFTFSSDINDFKNFIFFLLTLSGIISYLFFAPYLKLIFLPLKKEVPWKEDRLLEDKSIFYTYFYNISVVILTSFIFAWVVFWLWVIAIASFNMLFDLNIEEKYTYWNWTIISLSFLSPIFALINIPDKSSFSKSDFKVNVFFSFLIKYIAIIFISLYFLILYAYTVKVLLNFSDWPKWKISWLVIWFSIFWYLTYIFSYIFEKENKFINIFRKVLPYVVLFQIPMLFYAIYLRIWQYDFTVNRYFVVVFGLWLLVISLYFIISKKKNLIFIPAVLTLFTIIISIWPWWVYTFPQNRQLSRLEKNLIKANIFKNWKITPLKNYTDISQDLSKNIYSWIDYLCNFDNCEKIKKLFPKIYKEILEEDKKEWQKNKKREIERLENKEDYYKNTTDEYIKKRIKEIKSEKYKKPNKWTIVNKITEKIKVKRYFSTKDDKTFFEYSKKYNDDFFPIDIKNYSKIYRIQNENRGYKKDNYAKYNANTKIIEIIENWKVIKKIDTKTIEEILFKKFGKNNSRDLSKQDLTFELENWKYKLFFENLIIKNPDLKQKIDSTKNNLDVYMWWFTSWYILVR